MWKLSATKAIEFVTYPTTNSMTKKLVVRAIIESKRHFFPEYRPIFFETGKKEEMNINNDPAVGGLHSL